MTLSDLEPSKPQITERNVLLAQSSAHVVLLIFVLVVRVDVLFIGYAQ